MPMRLLKYKTEVRTFLSTEGRELRPSAEKKTRNLRVEHTILLRYTAPTAAYRELR